MAFDKSEGQSHNWQESKITNDEIEEVESRITGILHLIDQMQSVDTDSIEPMSHPFDGTQILRSDTITEENNRDELQKIAPKVENGLFLVPSYRINKCNLELNYAVHYVRENSRRIIKALRCEKYRVSNSPKHI